MGRDSPPGDATAVLEHVSEPVLTLDTDWRLTYVNEAASTFFELSTPVEETTLWSAWPALERSPATTRLQDARDANTVTSVDLPREDGVSCAASVHPEPDGLTLLVTDVSVDLGTADTSPDDRLYAEREAVFDRIADGFFALDTDWRLTYVNERAADLVDAERSELEGEIIWEVYEDAVGTKFEEQYRHALETQDPVEFEAAYEPLDTWFHLRAYPDETGLSVYFTTISEQKKRERELERYETIVETMNDGVYVVNGDGEFTMVNDEYARLTGYDREELLGAHVSMVVDEETISDAREIEAEMAADASAVSAIEAPLERADGTTVPAEARFALIDESDDPERIGVVRDITERRRRERELERRVEQQEYVAELGRRALSGEPLDDLFDDAVSTIADVLDVEYCKVLDLCPDEEELALRAGVGWNPGYVGEAAVETDRASQAGYTLASEEPVVVEDFADETRFVAPPLLVEHDVESGVSVVLGSDDDPLGVIGAHATAPRSYSDTDVSFVQAVANVLASAIDQQAYERELERYEVVTEQSTDVNTILDPEGNITYVTPSVEDVLGYTPEEVLGDAVLEYVVPEDRETVAEELAVLLDAEEEATTTLELELYRKSGTRATVEATARNLLHESHIEGVLVYTHDITERKARERQLREQRDKLAALTELNQVVRDVNAAVIESSTRSELERQVCTQLAASDSYAFAWVGEVDTADGEIVARTSAGAHEEYLESITIPYTDDGDVSGPTATAVRTGETQVVRDIEAPEYASWREEASEAGFRASAAIPLRYDGRQYGVLNVYSERAKAFGGRERTVVSQLGESIGHAISSLNRKEALISESAVELEVALPNTGVESGDADEQPEFTVERTIPLDDGEFLLYASASGLTEANVRAFVEQDGSNVERFRQVEDHDDVGLYEILFDEPPAITALAEYAGRVREITVRQSDVLVTVELPSEVDVREVVDAIAEQYRGASLVSQRQVTREPKSRIEYVSEVEDRLTDRQRKTLETALAAGYYEWPRESSASEVAEVLSIGDATVSQHLRAGHRKLCTSLFERDEFEGGN